MSRLLHHFQPAITKKLGMSQSELPGDHVEEFGTGLMTHQYCRLRTMELLSKDAHSACNIDRTKILVGHLARSLRCEPFFMR